MTKYAKVHIVMTDRNGQEHVYTLSDPTVAIDTHLAVLPEKPGDEIKVADAKYIFISLYGTRS